MIIDNFNFVTIVFFVLSTSKVVETKANILVDTIGFSFLYLNLCHRGYMKLKEIERLNTDKILSKIP